jgi:hypothetical protein
MTREVGRMRKFVAVAAVLGFVLLPGSAGADHGVESVRGGLHGEVFVIFWTISGNLSVSAQDAPSGTRGSVHFHQRNETLDTEVRFVGEVDCLQVTGNTAVLSGPITRFSGDLTDTERFMVEVTDGGNPTAGATTDSSLVYASSSTVVNPTTCVTPPNIGFFFTPEKGNITVHDDV